MLSKFKTPYSSFDIIPNPCLSRYYKHISSVELQWNMKIPKDTVLTIWKSKNDCKSLTLFSIDYTYSKTIFHKQDQHEICFHIMYTTSYSVECCWNRLCIKRYSMLKYDCEWLKTEQWPIFLCFCWITFRIFMYTRSSDV